MADRASSRPLLMAAHSALEAANCCSRCSERSCQPKTSLSAFAFAISASRHGHAAPRLWRMLAGNKEMSWIRKSFRVRIDPATRSWELGGDSKHLQLGKKGPSYS